MGYIETSDAHYILLLQRTLKVLHLSDMKESGITTVDAYIASFPREVRMILESMRQTITSVAKHGEETIKYGIPTIVLGGHNLVHFAAYKHHIGFYPSPSGIEAFKKEFSKYKTSKGAVQFPLNDPLPLTLVTKVVKMRIKENQALIKKQPSSK